MLRASSDDARLGSSPLLFVTTVAKMGSSNETGGAGERGARYSAASGGGGIAAGERSYPVAKQRACAICKRHFVAAAVMLIIITHPIGHVTSVTKSY